MAISDSEFDALGAKPIPDSEFDALGAKPVADAEFDNLGAKPVAEAAKPGLVWSDITTDAELNAIARKHNVNVNDLKDVAGYFGATKQDESPSDLIKQAAGFVGESAGLNVPQKLYKMLQDKSHEAALDELSELANKKKSYLREAADLLMPVAGAGTLGKLAGVGIGAAAGFGGSKAGEEVKGATLGGAIGGAVSAAVPAIAKGAEKLIEKAAPKVEKATPEIESKIEAELAGDAGKVLEMEKTALKKGYVDSPVEFAEKLGITTDSPAYLRAADEVEQMVGRAEPEQVFEKIAEDHMDVLREDLVKSVGAESWEKAVKEHGGIARLTEEELPQIRRRELSEKIIRRENLRPERKIGLLEGKLLKLSDDKPLMKVFDKRLGTNMEQVIDEASERMAQASQNQNSDLQLLGDFITEAKKRGITAENFDTLFNAGQLPADIKQKWTGLTTELLDRVNSRGAGIEAKADYIRHQIVAPDKLPEVFKAQIVDLDRKTGEGIESLTQDQFTNLLRSNKQFQDLVKGVELVTGEEVATASKLTNKLSDVLSHDVERGTNLQARISAAREKTGAIPEFLRETNQFKAMKDYITSVNNSLALRPVISKMKTAAVQAEAMGDNFAATHIRDKIQDLLGTRKDSISAAMSQAEKKWKAHMISRGQPALAKLPDYAKGMVANMYANLLGGTNVFASLQNLATPAISAIPDIGLQAGTASWLKSLAEITRLKKIVGEEGLEAFLAKKGLLKAHISPELARALGETSGTGYGVRKFNQIWTTLFEKSEQLARAQVYFMGQDLGEKIARNPEWGMKFISKLNSPGTRKAMLPALQRGDVAELQKQMTRYLNSNHLLNYDKAAQSAFGRYAGSLFSAFSKWPTTMWGKVAQELYDKGALRGGIEVGRKIIAPMVALQVVDTALRDRDIKHRSLSSLAPGESLVSGRGAPIYFKSVGDILGAVKDMDSAKFKKAVLSAASMYVPVAGAILRAEQDLNKQKGK